MVWLTIAISTSVGTSRSKLATRAPEQRAQSRGHATKRVVDARGIAPNSSMTCNQSASEPKRATAIGTGGSRGSRQTEILPEVSTSGRRARPRSAKTQTRHRAQPEFRDHWCGRHSFQGLPNRLTPCPLTSYDGWIRQSRRKRFASVICL